MARSAMDLDVRGLAEELADDWREATRDALTSPKIKNKLKDLDKNEGLEVMMLVLSTGGIFMPLARTGVQMTYSAVTIVANETKSRMKNVSNAQRMYEELIRSLNAAETRLYRNISNKTMYGPWQASYSATDRRRDIIERYFKTRYIDKQGSPWKLNKTRITNDMTTKIGKVIDEWAAIPKNCRRRALATAEGHTTVYMGNSMRTHVSSSWVDRCVKERRRQLKQRMAHQLM